MQKLDQDEARLAEARKLVNDLKKDVNDPLKLALRHLELAYLFLALYPPQLRELAD